MRVAYNNLIDDLNAFTLSALTEITGYEVTQVQDQRLTTVWKSSDATSQTVLATLPTLPEYPDDPAGVTYFNRLSFTGSAPVDEWSAPQPTSVVSSENGMLKVVFDGLDTGGARIRRSLVTSSKTVKVRVRSTNVLQNVRAFDGTTILLVTVPTVKISDYEWIVDLGVITSAATLDLYVNHNVAVANTVWYSWIYIGTGAYLPNSLLDLSGNANHGTIFGCTPVDTPYGRGLSGDGVNDYVAIPGVLSSTYTLQSWYRGTFTTGVTDTQGLLVIARDTGYLSRIKIYIVSGRGYAGAYSAGGSFVQLDSGINVADNLWHHIVATYDNTTLRIYIDGVLRNSVAVAITALFNVNGSLFLGSGGVYISGTIAQPRIYNRALSADEVLNLYNQTPFATENDSLAGFWDVDHGLGVDTVAIGGHNINTGTQVKIQASNTNEWSNPEVNETLTVNPDLIVKFLSSKKFYKYWRFSFGSQGNLEIGRLWLGEYLQIDPSSLNNFRVIKKRSDTVIHGKNRQKWALPGVGWRRFELSFPQTEEAMIYQLSNMYDEVGNHSSLIFCNFDDLVKYALVRPCYVSIDGDVGFQHMRRQKYEWSMTLEEEK